MLKKTETPPAKKKGPNIFGLLKPYKGFVILLIVLAMVGNGINLVLPKMIASGIDAYVAGTLILGPLATGFIVASLLVFVFAYLQNVVQTYAAERVAKDLRQQLSDVISRQSYAFVQEVTPAKLLTNLTSDIDGVKLFIGQAVASIISSLFLIIGSAVLLLLIDWRLALAVLTIIPIIGGTFAFVLKKVRVLFLKSQEIIDRLNKVINESILGAALIRVLHSASDEEKKFADANSAARNLGLKILKMFAAMIPIVTFVSGSATIIILALGGHFVINGSLTLGNLAAFNSYLMILIFPIFVIGMMSNIIARASASYARINEVLAMPPEPAVGTLDVPIRGDIEVRDVSVKFGEKMALSHVSFSMKAGTKTAIIGPTGAGKTQLLSILTALARPSEGTVLYDGRPIAEYDPTSLHRQIGFVFQDSILFNLTVQENIAFSDAVNETDMKKAIETAELDDFIGSLPLGLETVVSERATSLSGGQKQRLMLARALALNPKVLLLDDFTARVDPLTEKKILANIAKNYPGITIVSVTQKVASAAAFDQVILIMEAELLAQGTHTQLMKTSPEYVQIEQSQHSTNRYELRPE